MPATSRFRHRSRMAAFTSTTGYRALRKGRVSIPGQVYLVTTVCRNRQPWFGEWHCARVAASALGESRLWRGSQPLCWTLMPDHLHALVALGADEPLSRLMQRIKAVTARAAIRADGSRDAHLWMPGFHDRALRRDEDLLAVARYVIANPLRAGLASSVAAYPFWDAIWIGNGLDLP
ncbi:REP-associated tyrosine transposase [Luteimonas sp. R10]|uniref:REP-associated tyrosine transposase n=1 Tax=Luteimonas sp. R10 TaxID=3108176 RepID=UPI00308A6A49|nr:transposase [Luteimonas sp. R10]